MKRKVEWRDIPGYDGLYQISTDGQIKSLPRKGSPKENILKGTITKAGYKIVNLCMGSKRRTFNVHNLMAVTYLGYQSGNRSIVCDHVNSDKTDNRLENLRLVSARFNVLKDKVGKGTSKYPGVSWNTANKRWVAAISVGDKSVYLGSYKVEQQAGLAYTVALELSAVLINTDKFRDKVNEILMDMAKRKMNQPNLQKV